MKLWGVGFSFALSNVLICGLVVAMCFSEKSSSTIMKIVKNKFIEYKNCFVGRKLFTSRMKTFDTAKESLDPILSLK